MKIVKIVGKYEYQDPIKINQVDYFFENIKWEATKEDLINKAAHIRQEYPYLEEIKIISKALLDKYPYLSLLNKDNKK